MGFRLPGMGDWTMPTASVENAGPGTYANYMANNPDAWAGNGTDYLGAINQKYGENPGSFEDWSYSKDIPYGMQESERDSYLRQQYNNLLGNYQQGQELINSQYAFAPDQKLTTKQLSDLGMNLTPFQGYDKQNAAWANDPMGNTQMFVQNPDGTYTAAVNRPSGLSGGYKTIQVNDPTKQGSWTDYMDTAITIGSALGAGFAGAGSLGLLGAAGEGAALGSTGAGSIDAYMAGAGLDAGTFGGAAFTMPELAAATAEAIPFELPDGTMGSIQNGNILDASGNVVAKGGVDLTAAEVLRYANQARQGLGVASTLAKLLGSGAVGGATSGTSGGATSKTGGLRPQEIAKYLSGMATPAQAGPVPYQIKMNQNPFTFDIPGQTKATEGMYDVSGVNPMANALRKA